MTKQALLLIVSLIFASSCGGQQEIDKIGMEGVRLFENGNIQGALEKFNEIIEIDSLNSEAYLRKADCFDLLGDFQNSILNYSKAIEIDSKNKLAYYNRALTYEKVGDFHKVLIDYNSSINVDPNNDSEPDNKRIYQNIGILYGQMNQLDSAIKSFTNAIEIDDKYADGYHNRGYAYQLKGEHKIAIDNFNIAIQLNPNEQEYKNSKSRSEKLLKR
jgi:tetratricopeptide (TPR) repeat protein